MKRFEFRLEKVMDYRKKVEQGKKRELAKAKYSLFEAKHRLVRLKNHLTQQLDEMDKLNRGDIYTRLLYDQYLLRVNNNIVDTEENVTKCTEKVEANRKKLIESSKERKVVEKLKQRRKEEFNHARQRWNQAIDDESAKYRCMQKTNA